MVDGLDLEGLIVGGLFSLVGSVLGAYFGSHYEAWVRWINRPRLVIKQLAEQSQEYDFVNEIYFDISNNGKATAKSLECTIFLYGIELKAMKQEMTVSPLAMKNESSEKNLRGIDAIRAAVESGEYETMGNLTRAEVIKPRSSDEAASGEQTSGGNGQSIKNGGCPNPSKYYKWMVTGILSRLHPSDNIGVKVFSWNSEEGELFLEGTGEYLMPSITRSKFPITGEVRVMAEDTESIKHIFSLDIIDGMPKLTFK